MSHFGLIQMNWFVKCVYCGLTHLWHVSYRVAFGLTRLYSLCNFSWFGGSNRLSLAKPFLFRHPSHPYQLTWWWWNSILKIFYQKAKLAPFSLWYVLLKFIFILKQVNFRIFFFFFYKQFNVLSFFFRSNLRFRGGLNISLKQFKN